jgi:hypothetical protein
MQSWNDKLKLGKGSRFIKRDLRLLPPPTVNDLANLLAHAMLRPLTDLDRQRPRKIQLRDRPQWPEFFPHLQQLGIQVVLADDLPWLDRAVLECVQHKAGRETHVHERLMAIAEKRCSSGLAYSSRQVGSPR